MESLLIFHQNVINSLIFQQIFNFTKFFLQIYISKKWGFTKWDREEYEGMRESGKFFEFSRQIFRAVCLQDFVYILGKLVQDGVNVKYMPDHGPLSAWCKIQAELAGL